MKARDLCEETAMTNPENPRYVEITDGDRTVAAAEVAASGDAGGTARASLHAESGHVPPGTRTDLVDAVMDLPEVQASTRLEASVPLGDSESLERLRQRTKETVTRPAGSTALVEAAIPAEDQSADKDQEPLAAGLRAQPPATSRPDPSRAARR
jgi:uncharacterized phage protein gp47/JayE